MYISASCSNLGLRLQQEEARKAAQSPTRTSPTSNTSLLASLEPASKSTSSNKPIIHRRQCKKPKKKGRITSKTPISRSRC